MGYRGGTHPQEVRAPKEHGQESPPRKKRRWLRKIQKRVLKAHELRKMGLRVELISREMGVTMNTVYKYLQRKPPA
jgi:hypothetical protein